MQITDGYSLFMHVWPWMGLGAAIVIWIIAFGTDLMRKDTSKGRWLDPAWLAWIGTSAYMLHNVEEYGVAADGQLFAFPQLMESLGLTGICEPAYLATNIGLIWIAGPVAAVMARRLPGVAPGMAVFELVNAVSHIAQGLNIGYNPGLLTSCAVFVPLCAWTLYVCYFRECQHASTFGLVLLSAVVYHGILFAGIAAARFAGIPAWSQGLIMACDALLIVFMWRAAGRHEQKLAEA